MARPKKNVSVSKKGRSLLPYGGVLVVQKVIDQPLGKQLPYWANWSKGVCRQTKLESAGCWVDHTQQKALKVKYIRKSSPAQKRTACEVAGGFYTDETFKPMRAGKIELDFLSKTQAKRLNMQEGAVLRLCATGQQPGRLMSHTSSGEAAVAGKKFQSCIDDQIKVVAAACAVKVAGKNAPLGMAAPDIASSAGAGMLRGCFQRGR